MHRSVIVRCLGKVGTDDVLYDARAVCDPWPGSEAATPDYFGSRGSDYQRDICVWVEPDMSYRVYIDSISATGAADLYYTPDQMHAIQTPDTLFVAIDVARAYAWPKEYAAWQRDAVY